jgi:hypothetical protein
MAHQIADSLALAVIMPRRDTYLARAAGRPHYLIRTHSDLERLLASLPPDRRGEYDAHALFAAGLTAVRDAIARITDGAATMAIVDSTAVADDWPSAGDRAAWTSDVWRGLDDYLSALEWSEQVGTSCDYTLTDEQARECVRRCGRDSVLAAIYCLAADDPIRHQLLAAIYGTPTRTVSVRMHDSDDYRRGPWALGVEVLHADIVQQADDRGEALWHLIVREDDAERYEQALEDCDDVIAYRWLD